MITISQLHFAYASNEAYALKNINLHIPTGDFVGIIGNSGSGKSTLCHAMNGIIPHRYDGDFYGEVILNGLDTVNSGPEALALQVGSVLEDIDAQTVASIVEDEILFGLENFGVPKTEIPHRIAQALQAIGISDLRSRRLDALSGGQKQKVIIAAVIALSPKILILDEPTGELDPKSSVQLFELLRTLNETHGMTIVVVEQKPALLAAYVKRMILLDKGEIRLDAPTREAFSDRSPWDQLHIRLPKGIALAHALRDSKGYTGAIPLNFDETLAMISEVCHVAI